VNALSIVRRRSSVFVAGIGMLALAGCGDAARVAAPPVLRGEPSRVWTFGVHPPNRTSVINGPRQEQQGGVVDDVREFPGTFGGPPPTNIATARVLSSADGTTYAVSTEVENTVVTLTQTQQFRKVSRNAFLRFVITRAEMRGGIFNTNSPSRDCVDLSINCVTESAGVSLDIRGWRDIARPGLFKHFATLRSTMTLYRDANRWFYSGSGSVASINATSLLWVDGHFVPDFVPGQNASTASVSLPQSRVVRLDLAELDTGETFTIRTEAIAETYANGGGGETYTHAYLRDPAGVGGTNVEFEGLEQMSTPSPEPTEPTFGEAPQCTTSNAGAGTLQFSRAAYRRDEIPIGGVQAVTVTRTGGSSGQVSATVTTSDGTAIVGADYAAVIGTVSFADGDTEPRSINVPITLDTIAEPDKSLTLTLSNPRGCATLGASTATLTIVDDDRPRIQESFAVGGSISGLVGSGLVLENAIGGEVLPVSGSTFTFVRRTLIGAEYNVRVATQPANPAQVCTVANASGRMASAPVTNVAVTCVTPPPVSGLDPGFGIGGRVVTPLTGGRGEAVAVQPDGKIVVAGKGSSGGAQPSFDFTVLRYLPNGTPDAGFGTGGVAQVNFPAGRTDDALDVALQADGRIVVVGSTQTASGELDFGVARFNTDGTVDRSFGTNGVATIDFGAGSATAQGVAIQPDGRIVVAGHAQVGPPNNDFAVARFNADGTPDASFGTAGRVTSPLTGRADLGMAVALAPDGKIVVAGRAEQSGTRGDDFAVARYTSAGVLDPSFGAGAGFVTTDFASGSEQANDVAVLADGRIVAAGYSGASTGTFDYAVARYTSDGRPDATFNGVSGTVKTDLSGNDDFAEGLVVLADGRIVVVGRRTGVGGADVALTRYLPSGALDTSFGTAGRVEVDVFGTFDEGQGIALQPDGRIVAVGATRNGTAPQVLVVRVVP
jgi:uncharacterized delta-60 repeat protein